MSSYKNCALTFSSAVKIHVISQKRKQNFGLTIHRGS